MAGSRPSALMRSWVWVSWRVSLLRLFSAAAELSGGSVGVSERAQAKLVELVSAGVLGGGARAVGIAHMLICDLDGVTDRLEF